MRKTPFIWLGSGRARRRNVARKGMLLDRAASLGLPVPIGGILLDDFYRICLSEGVVELAGDVVLIPDPVWLHQVLFRDIRFPRLAKPVAVRPAEMLMDLAGLSTHCTQLAINLEDPVQLSGALRLVWSAIQRTDDDRPHDVLLMEMVTCQTAGSAWTVAASKHDQIQLTTGTDIESLDRFELKKIRTFQRASSDLPAYRQRLQKLLRGVRRSFGKGDWRFDWADDGKICWLLQIY